MASGSDQATLHGQCRDSKKAAIPIHALLIDQARTSLVRFRLSHSHTGATLLQERSEATAIAPFLLFSILARTAALLETGSLEKSSKNASGAFLGGAFRASRGSHRLAVPFLQ